jgi:acyl-CoA thioesterase YciA
MEKNVKTPVGDLTIQVLAMPADTNPDGDIFGGWLLSQMDIAGAYAAKRKTQWRHRVVTVAIEKMCFVKPVFVGDVLRCYCEVAQIGNTSISVAVEAWAERGKEQLRKMEKVTEGVFTYVAIDEDRIPIPVKG